MDKQLLVMYKKSLCLFVSFLFFAVAFAQQNTKNTVAPFKITLVNGKEYTYKQLAKNKAAVLVYFSPTCDHCKAFTAELMKHEKELQAKQIIMVSYLPINDVKQFDEAYHLSSHSNIKVGTEGYSFIVQKYYNIQRFPFVAIYGKDGNLVKIIPSQLKPEEIAAQVLN